MANSLVDPMAYAQDLSELADKADNEARALGIDVMSLDPEYLAERFPHGVVNLLQLRSKFMLMNDENYADALAKAWGEQQSQSQCSNVKDVSSVQTAQAAETPSTPAPTAEMDVELVCIYFLFRCALV